MKSLNVIAPIMIHTFFVTFRCFSFSSFRGHRLSSLFQINWIYSTDPSVLFHFLWWLRSTAILQLNHGFSKIMTQRWYKDDTMWHGKQASSLSTLQWKKSPLKLLTMFCNNIWHAWCGFCLFQDIFPQTMLVEKSIMICRYAVESLKKMLAFLVEKKSQQTCTHF